MQVTGGSRVLALVALQFTGVWSCSGGGEADLKPAAMGLASALDNGNGNSSGGLPIYTDWFQDPFSDWSWTMHNMAATSTVHSGAASLEMDPSNYGGVKFHAFHGVSSGLYTSLDFYVNGGSAGGQSLRVMLNLDTNTTTQFVLAEKYVGGSIGASTWGHATIPLSDFNVGGAGITDVIFMGNGGGSVPLLYLDDISLLSGVPALLVYDDRPENGFANISWGGGVNIYESQVVHSGTNAISFTPNNWNGIQLKHPNQISLANYSGLSFWINGGSNGGQLLWAGVTGTPEANYRLPLAAYLPTGSVQANTWQQVIVPFADLKATQVQADSVYIMDATGKSQSTVYVDDISIVSTVNGMPPIPDTTPPVVTSTGGGTGGPSTGGSSTAGSSTGGTSAGSTSAGGSSTSGTSAGSTTADGSSTSGTSTGGTNTGGTSTGGTTADSSTSSTSTGGGTTAGSSTSTTSTGGGTTAGGTTAGGTTAGGTTAGGTTTGGTTGAPAGWLYTSGNSIYNSDGSLFKGRGANIADPRGCGACTGTDLNTSTQEVLRRIDMLTDQWGANFMRLDLESYNTSSILSDPNYLAAIQQIVQHVGTKSGVVLEVSVWVDPSLSSQGWPTTQTDQVLSTLAQTFYNVPYVIFGIANEPQSNYDGSLDADVWDAMNAAATSIRTAEQALGSNKHLIAAQGTGGWARFLQYYMTHPLTAGDGSNFVYEVHVYDAASTFQDRFITPSTVIPVIIGEFGPSSGFMALSDCTTLMTQAEQAGVPYMGWTFHMRCPPNLLVDNSNGGCGVGMTLTPTSDWGTLLMNQLAQPW